MWSVCPSLAHVGPADQRTGCLMNVQCTFLQVHASRPAGPRIASEFAPVIAQIARDRPGSPMARAHDGGAQAIAMPSDITPRRWRDLNPREGFALNPLSR